MNETPAKEDKIERPDTDHRGADTVEINGKEYGLLMTMAAIDDLERHTDMGMYKIIMDMGRSGNPRMGVMAKAVYHFHRAWLEDRGIKPEMGLLEEINEGILAVGVIGVTKPVGDWLMNNAMGKQKDDGGKKPGTGTPDPNSTGSQSAG